jgi:hypothetical protein
MPRFQLKDKCLFVDASAYDESNHKPGHKIKCDVIDSAHILDQRVDPPAYLMLNSGAAFITRFIVLGVDTINVIPQILQSEYSGSGAIYAKEVSDVVQMLSDYIETRTYQRPHETPANLGAGRQAPGKRGYPLDFKVNWFGGGVFKGPL